MTTTEKDLYPVLEKALDIMAAKNDICIKPSDEWPDFINYGIFESPLKRLTIFELELFSAGEHDVQQSVAECYGLQPVNWFFNSIFDGELSPYFLVPVLSVRLPGEVHQADIGIKFTDPVEIVESEDSFDEEGRPTKDIDYPDPVEIDVGDVGDVGDKDNEVYVGEEEDEEETIMQFMKRENEALHERNKKSVEVRAHIWGQIVNLFSKIGESEYAPIVDKIYEDLTNMFSKNAPLLHGYIEYPTPRMEQMKQRQDIWHKVRDYMDGRVVPKVGLEQYKIMRGHLKHIILQTR